MHQPSIVVPTSNELLLPVLGLLWRKSRELHLGLELPSLTPGASDVTLHPKPRQMPHDRL